MLRADVVLLLAALTLTAVSLVGIAVGRLTAVVRRHRWSARTALADAGVAVGAGIATAVGLAVGRAGTGAGPAWAVGAAALAVVLRHLAGPAARRDTRAPRPNKALQLTYELRYCLGSASALSGSYAVELGR